MQIIQNMSSRTVLSILVAITLFSLAFSARSHFEAGNVNWWAWADSAFQNFSTEMMGAIMTFVLFELVIGARQRRDAVIVERQRLQANALARLKQAKTLEERQPIIDEMKANDLLRGADLVFADLEGANLGSTNLKRANLWNANLTGVYLKRANLEGADLRESNLEGANLGRANLEGSDFNDLILLPDGTKWAPDTDMKRFTDPNHPDFWQSE